MERFTRSHSKPRLSIFTVFQLLLSTYAQRNRTMVMSSCLTHLILPFLLLSTNTRVKCCCGAFLPRSCIIRPQYHRTVVFVKNSEGVAADDVDNSRPLGDRRYLLKQKLTEHFERLSSDDSRNRAPPSIDSECEMYTVGEKFMDGDLYWITKTREERFQETFVKGCLYRPSIVEDLYAEVLDALNSRLPWGIFVKGPHGIGKSHLLVNLVRKLLYGSDGKYLVTFIPDCSRFEDERSLLDAICSSFGTTPEELGNPNVSIPHNLQQLINEIDSILKDKDKQWVFIYDQINIILARLQFRKYDNLTTLRFPFDMIFLAMKGGRIMSIISASANNEIAFKQMHEGFKEYYHPLTMEWNEIKTMYPSLRDCNKDLVMEVTGGVPLQVSNLMKAGLDIELYVNKESESIRSSLQKLEEDFTKKGMQWVFEDIKKSAIGCVLGRTGHVLDYDRKYSVPRQGESYYYDPLFPLVLSVYREYFWDDILALLSEFEAKCLSTCANPQTTNDVRGRLLVSIVIDRCKHCTRMLPSNEHDVTDAEFPGLWLCQPVAFNSSKTLPPFESMAPDGIYVPSHDSFPVMDIIWRMGNVTWFVKVHVDGDIDNMLPELKAMCQEAGWQGKIFYLYLSPEKKIAKLLPKDFLSIDQETGIVVKALSIKSFYSLKHIPWPEGCSLS